MSSPRILIPLMIVLLSAGQAQAQTLDSDTIDRWVTTMQEMKAFENELSEEDAIDMDMDMEDPMDIEQSMARAAEQSEKVRRTINRHGFTDGAEWAAIGSRIMRAYGAMMMQEQAPEMDRQLQQQMQAIENNPNIPEQQKAMMRQQMQASQGMMQQMTDAPQADIDAVQASRERLGQIFEDDN